MNTSEKPALDIDLSPVANSSNVAAIGYHAPTRRMAVQFKSGSTHIYADVKPEDHAAFAGAESVGKHFHAHVRNVFKSTKHE